MADRRFVAPSLARGAGSFCDLDGCTLDGPLVSPRIDFGYHTGFDFDADCRRLAAHLAAGEPVEFGYGCLTAFTVAITPEAAIDGGFPSWVGLGRQGFVRVALRIGSLSQWTTYYHPLGRGGQYAYIAEKHRLKEHDARAISYLLAALGEAVDELGALPYPPKERGGA